MEDVIIFWDALDGQTALVDGYVSFYSFCRNKSGYSGVATYCREDASPVAAEQGITGQLAGENSDIGYCQDVLDAFGIEDLRALDAEGRTLITQHLLEGDAIMDVINVYCPRADPDRPHRLEFKLKFYQALELRAKALVKAGHYVLIVGDLNTSHRRIDHCNPESYIEEEFDEEPCRLWLDKFLNEAGFIDTFRWFHPDQSLLKYFRDSQILSDIFGSDHCPVKGFLDVNFAQVPGPTCLPSLCTKFYPEFTGKQMTMKNFLQQKHNYMGHHVDTLCDSIPVERSSKREEEAPSLFQAFPTLLSQNSAKKRTKSRQAVLVMLSWHWTS
ncbi:unnamed protein product [Darwinula stevensoni]|uniref:exodeoxyribonuclease III n=1 Tax=Darwinula stevensoni TaxID=69355 RepID=A0A7R9FPY0_9CRUS|nr:unnamed protein product [Darwinula stevensoni]CAG0898394.1 unnamed protein product [Darwinula stevensoni]